MKQNNIIQLSDGRQLGFAEYGDAAGTPIIYFHGGQESRKSALFMESPAQELGIKIIAPDRPGIGLSSFQPDRLFLDWPRDVTELANSLGLDKFSVLGLSGGAPHVLACAHEMSNRISRASIVAGTTPYQGTTKGMWFPVKLVHWFATREKDNYLRRFVDNDRRVLSQKPESRIRQFQKYLPKPDRELMSRSPEYAWQFVQGSLESYAQGIEGVVQEWKLYVGDWGFDVSAIKGHISLWYGDKDKMAPEHRGRYYQTHLPNCNLHLVPNEGHFSLIRNHLDEILSDLVAVD